MLWGSEEISKKQVPSTELNIDVCFTLGAESLLQNFHVVVWQPLGTRFDCRFAGIRSASGRIGRRRVPDILEQTDRCKERDLGRRCDAPHQQEADARPAFARYTSSRRTPSLAPPRSLRPDAECAVRRRRHEQRVRRVEADALHGILMAPTAP